MMPLLDGDPTSRPNETDARSTRNIQTGWFLGFAKPVSEAEISLLRARLPALFDEPSECNIREKHSGEVRSALALHQRDELFARLTRHPRLVGPARQISATDLYIQQVKVNVKGAFGGELFQWHYDFATHHHEDGSPAPRALNLHVFLSDVNEFNGPLYFIPGSHLGTPRRPGWMRKPPVTPSGWSSKKR